MEEKQILSPREARLAAEMGKPVSSTVQNKILQKAVEDTKKRVEQLNKMKEEEQARKAEEERLANIPLMGKRQRLEYEKQQDNQADQFRQEEIKREQYYQQNKVEEPTNINRRIVNEDIKNLAIERSTSFLFKPSLYTNSFKKIQVEEVPSHFLSYPDNVEIFITPYSGDDIDELSNSKLPLKYILTRCMEGVYTNFDKNQITFYDTLYLSYLRRVLSINPEDSKIQVLSQCPYCGKWSNTIINIKEQIEFEDIKIPALPINVDFSFGRLQFSFLTYGNYMKLQTDLRSEELAYQCITPCEVNTKEDETPEGELQKLFGSLVGEDQVLLNKVRELTYHGIKSVNTLCQNTECGKTYETIIDEMSCIILPFRKSSQDIKSKVSFG